MGLLTPTLGYGKSFGIYGQGQLKGDYNPEEYSFISNPAEMVDATAINNYLAVSVWANSWTAATNSGEISIRFSSSKWADYATEWAAPATPASADLPDTPI